jgi:hypothetical protein
MIVPPGRDPHHLSSGLTEAVVADGEADFAAGASCLNESGTLKDGEVLGDALACDGHGCRERARCRRAALEQEVEQAQAHRVAERRPQAICILAFLRHHSPSEPIAWAA